MARGLSWKIGTAGMTGLSISKPKVKHLRVRYPHTDVDNFISRTEQPEKQTNKQAQFALTGTRTCDLAITVRRSRPVRNGVS